MDASLPLRRHGRSRRALRRSRHRHFHEPRPRSFGPALAAGEWHDFWIYLAGPITGAIVGALAYQWSAAIIRHRRPIRVAHALFVCLHDAGRSQMSQALFERAAGGRHKSSSANSTSERFGLPVLN